MSYRPVRLVRSVIFRPAIGSRIPANRDTRMPVSRRRGKPIHERHEPRARRRLVALTRSWTPRLMIGSQSRSVGRIFSPTGRRASLHEFIRAHLPRLGMHLQTEAIGQQTPHHPSRVCACGTAVSDFADTSNRSDRTHAGPPMTWKSRTRYANSINCETLTFGLTNRSGALGMPPLGVSLVLGLIEMTSNAGSSAGVWPSTREAKSTTSTPRVRTAVAIDLMTSRHLTPLARIRPIVAVRLKPTLRRAQPALQRVFEETRDNAGVDGTGTASSAAPAPSSLARARGYQTRCSRRHAEFWGHAAAA